MHVEPQPDASQAFMDLRTVTYDRERDNATNATIDVTVNPNIGKLRPNETILTDIRQSEPVHLIVEAEPGVQVTIGSD